MRTQFRYRLGEYRLVPPDDPEAEIIVVVAPSDEECAELTEEFLIDEHTLQSALDPDETARLEFEPTHVAVIVKRPHAFSDGDETQFRVTSIGAFLFAERLIILQRDETSLSIPRRRGNTCGSLAGVLLEVIYRSILQFSADVKQIQRVSERIEQRIEYSLENRALSAMFNLQKGLVYYRSALQSNQALLGRLRIHADRIGLDESEREFLDDIIVENEQCLKLVVMYSDILTGMSDARVSIISNNLNIIMKKLTVLSIIFMPLNIIASIFGMSEWSAITQNVPWTISYSLFSVGLVIVGYVTWLFVRNIGIEEAPGRWVWHAPRGLRTSLWSAVGSRLGSVVKRVVAQSATATPQVWLTDKTEGLDATADAEGDAKEDRDQPSHGKRG
ncbi:MAG: magnesium transporter CorA family protein [Armatimonadetes bacterium]|nr:magnesium transporter CorA family protein [Armatimonadota bacterium]